MTPNATARFAGRGFSLLELVLVMVIVVTISAIAIPRMSSSTNNSRADQALDRAWATIEHARSLARSRSRPISVRFNTGNERAIVKMNSSTLYKVYFVDSPYHADLTASSFGGDDTVIFDGFGYPDTGGTLSLVVGTTTRTLTFDGPPSSDSTLRTSTLLRSTELDAVDSGQVTKGATGAGQVVQ